MRQTLSLALILLAGALPALAQAPPPPSSPLEEKPPVWTRTMQMPDGGRWVSDGGLAIDAAIAKPAQLPTVVIPAESSKAVVARSSGPHLREIGLGELRRGSRANTYVSPDGVGLNGNYVTFLRRMAPRVRLQLRSEREPVTILLDQRIVGIVMPMIVPENRSSSPKP